MSWFSDMRGYHSALGPVRFWALLFATIVFILGLAAAHIWLTEKVGWPEAYGFNCHGRGCLFDDLSHSPKLLRGGSPPELGLFALFWWMPALLSACFIWAIIQRLRRKPFSRLK